MKNILLFIIVILTSGQLIGQADPCATTGDSDGDGICDPIDPCPTVFNTGDDNDGDSVLNECDNSPLFNPDQADIDNDGIGDVSDPCVDPDGDGVCGAQDKCPGGDDNIDLDRDGIPDDCDDCVDEDGDDICDDVDDCISTRMGNSCDDGDACTSGDILDAYCNCTGQLIDTDNDGVCDLEDVCPGFDDTRDFDNDGIPDGCDDSPACTSCTPDGEDKIRICHFYMSGNTATIRGACEQLEKYFDGIGNFVDDRDHCGPCTCADAGDVDSDGDGICDKLDPCPNDPNDSDNDGVCDSQDVCPGSDDALDSDGDGIPDGCDEIEYCTPAYNTTWEWISSLELDGVSYSNGQSTSLELYDVTGQHLEKGMTHTLLITPEYIDDIAELSTHVYIDINGDGDFDDGGELLYEGRSLDPTNVALDIEDWDVGTYRMRVILHYGRIHNACQEGVEGEIEDLLIKVIGVQACAQVLEPFDYGIETLLEEAAGVSGWKGNWNIEKEDASSQVSILNSSLADGSGNKIGILNAAGTTVHMTREFNANLTGSTSLSFSILLERVSGSGSVDIHLGDLAFGVSSDGSFYLEDQSMGQLSLNEATEIYVQINLNQDGTDEVTMRINPDDSAEVGASATKELGSRIETLDISISSEDSFVPSIHYIDEIQIGCDTNFEKKGSSGKRSLLKRSFESPQIAVIESELSVWPNPIMGSQTNVLLKGNKATYTYQLSSVSGVVVVRGQMLPGLNRLQFQNLESGVYYITVDTESGILSKKLIL